MQLREESVWTKALEDAYKDLDSNKWVARVSVGWSRALNALREWDEKGLEGIDPPSRFDEIEFATSPLIEAQWVQVSKDLIYERADLIRQLKKILWLVERSVDDGAIPFESDTDLIKSWPKALVVAAYQLGLVLSHKPTLRYLAGYSIKDGPRDSTAQRRKKVTALWPIRYDQVKTARKRYTANKKDDWKAIVTKANPQLPAWLIDELPRKSEVEPKELAAKWLAEDLHSTTSAILEDVKVLKKSGEL